MLPQTKQLNANETERIEKKREQEKKRPRRSVVPVLNIRNLVTIELGRTVTFESLEVTLVGPKSSRQITKGRGLEEHGRARKKHDDCISRALQIRAIGNFQ